MSQLRSCLLAGLTLVAPMSATAATTPSPVVDPALRLASPPQATAHPALWPAAHDPVGLDPAIESRIDGLLAVMTIEEKVGQTLQPEMKSITPAEVTAYHIGSLENGGGSTPGGDKHAPLRDWLKVIDGFWEASVSTAPGRPRIPLMWASDAVHGHNNVYGATLFPHNIGLGAARDPELIGEIGGATAEEVRATGMDWSFAPTLAVARDDRWGRTFESYAEDSRVVAAYAQAMVTGLQGQRATFLDRDHVISTAKHFLGDGGTDGGRDQGDTRVDEAELRDIHGAGYVAAVDAGVQAVMASFSSWNGFKMHANQSLLTGVLKGRFGFDGLVIGDWNAHGQVPGCTLGDCPAVFNAGVDVFNVPQDWRTLYVSMVAEVRSGAIPMSRLDDAVRRVLRVKLRAHVFDEPRPSTRSHAGDPRSLGSPAHRAIARRAVAESLVLLKNNGGVLPLKGGAHILVAGDAADSMARQAGGWTLSWQGADNTNADFPGATTLWAGLRQAIEAQGGEATLSVDGRFTRRPDAAIVIFGEGPYAEFQGDQADVALHEGADESLALIRRLKAQGVPVVAVLVSGRPLYMNPVINAADAFVAAWLPGSEGEGLADVIVGDPSGHVRQDFRGRLSFSWPRRPDQTPLNLGEAGYHPQFAYGYGLSYGHPAVLPLLQEARIEAASAPRGVFFAEGHGANGFHLFIGDRQAPRIAAVGARTATYGAEELTVTAVDRRRQEDARQARWSGRGEAWFELASAHSMDLRREANGAMALTLDLRVDQGPSAPVSLSMGDGKRQGDVPLASRLATTPAGQWRAVRIPLSCFAQSGGDLSSVDRIRLSTAGQLTLTLSDIRLEEAQAGDTCPAGTSR